MDFEACEQERQRTVGQIQGACTDATNPFVRNVSDPQINTWYRTNISYRAIATICSRQHTRSFMRFGLLGVSNRHTFMKGWKVEDGLGCKECLVLYSYDLRPRPETL